MEANRRKMPNVWGPGQLLAFSAIDGFTDVTEPFVLHTGARPASFVVRLPIEAGIDFPSMPQVDFEMILGDVIIANSARGDFRCAFLDHHTLIGEVPADVSMTADGKPVGEDPELIGEAEDLALSAAIRGRRWCLMVSRSRGGQVNNQFEKALTADLDDVIEARSSYVRKIDVPDGIDASRAALLRKALSVMKVNIEAPCGRISRRWSTGDRWPHRYMWLWDSAFHAIGFARVAPAVAKEIVLAVIEQVRQDGMLPHMIPPTGPPSQITQPPILAWCALDILQRTDDVAWARECVPYLFRHLEWIRRNRDRNANAVPEWYIEDNPLCRCGESGLDNSPRFDRAVPLDAVDFASFLYNDYLCLGRIAERVGEGEIKRACSDHAARIASAVNDLLWSGEDGFYFDRDFDGKFVEIKAASGFMPLFAGIAGSDRAEQLRRHLNDRRSFAAPLPVPTVSLDSGLYCKDMWRGPTWFNLNYLIYRGLRRYGFSEDASRLKEATLSAGQKWYEKDGCLWEFYDSLDLTPPRCLDRKQRLITGRGMAPISDYHWTAAVIAALILEDRG